MSETVSQTMRSPVPWEVERYELTAPPAYRFDLDRRDFFKFLGGGLLLVSVLKPAAWSQESGREGSSWELTTQGD